MATRVTSDELVRRCSALPFPFWGLHNGERNHPKGETDLVRRTILPGRPGGREADPPSPSDSPSPSESPGRPGGELREGFGGCHGPSAANQTPATGSEDPEQRKAPKAAKVW